MSNLIELVAHYAETRHKHGAPEYNAVTRLAWEAVKSAFEQRLADTARLDSGCILLHSRDEFGEPYIQEIRGLDLRKAIDEAIEAQGDVERIIE